MKTIYQLIIIKCLKRITNPTLINFMKTQPFIHIIDSIKLHLRINLKKLKKTRTKHYQVEAQIFFHPLEIFRCRVTRGAQAYELIKTIDYHKHTL